MSASLGIKPGSNNASHTRFVRPWSPEAMQQVAAYLEKRISSISNQFIQAASQREQASQVLLRAISASLSDCVQSICLRQASPLVGSLTTIAPPHVRQLLEAAVNRDLSCDELWYAFEWVVSNYNVALTQKGSSNVSITASRNRLLETGLLHRDSIERRPWLCSSFDGNIAQVYSASRPMSAPFIDMLRCFAQETLANKDILEVGAGTGRIGAVVAPFATKYVAIDSSEAMLAELRREFDKQKIDNYDIVHGDAMQIPMADKCCDAVVEHQAFTFMENYDVALTECQRVLRRDGVLVRIVLQQTDSTVIALHEAFKTAIATHESAAFEMHESGQDALIEQKLCSYGFSTQLNVVSSWSESMLVDDLFESLRRRAYPYLRHVSEGSLKAGIAAVESFVRNAIPDRKTRPTYVLTFHIASKTS